MSVLDKFILTGRASLITGGNRGLGKQMALAITEADAPTCIQSQFFALALWRMNFAHYPV